MATVFPVSVRIFLQGKFYLVFVLFSLKENDIMGIILELEGCPNWQGAGLENR